MCQVIGVPPGDLPAPGAPACTFVFGFIFERVPWRSVASCPLWGPCSPAVGSRGGSEKPAGPGEQLVLSCCLERGQERRAGGTAPGLGFLCTPSWRGRHLDSGATLCRTLATASSCSGNGGRWHPGRPRGRLLSPTCVSGPDLSLVSLSSRLRLLPPAGWGTVLALAQQPCAPRARGERRAQCRAREPPGPVVSALPAPGGTGRPRPWAPICWWRDSPSAGRGRELASQCWHLRHRSGVPQLRLSRGVHRSSVPT